MAVGTQEAVEPLTLPALLTWRLFPGQHQSSPTVHAILLLRELLGLLSPHALSNCSTKPEGMSRESLGQAVMPNSLDSSLTWTSLLL